MCVTTMAWVPDFRTCNFIPHYHILPCTVQSLGLAQNTWHIFKTNVFSLSLQFCYYSVGVALGDVELCFPHI